MFCAGARPQPSLSSVVKAPTCACAQERGCMCTCYVLGWFRWAVCSLHVKGEHFSCSMFCAWRLLHHEIMSQEETSCALPLPRWHAWMQTGASLRKRHAGKQEPARQLLLCPSGTSRTTYTVQLVWDTHPKPPLQGKHVHSFLWQPQPCRCLYAFEIIKLKRPRPMGQATT